MIAYVITNHKYLEDVLVEVQLQLLVRVVDTHLLEAVFLHARGQSKYHN